MHERFIRRYMLAPINETDEQARVGQPGKAGDDRAHPGVNVAAFDPRVDADAAGFDQLSGTFTVGVGLEREHDPALVP